MPNTQKCPSLERRPHPPSPLRCMNVHIGVVRVWWSMSGRDEPTSNPQDYAPCERRAPHRDPPRSHTHATREAPPQSNESSPIPAPDS